MTGIALYNILRKVDGVTDAEAKEAITNKYCRYKRGSYEGIHKSRDSKPRN